MATYDDGLLHYPPKFSPEYEKERGDIGDLEFRMQQAADEANRLYELAYRAYDADDEPSGDRLIDQSNRWWVEYGKLKAELEDLEQGW